MSAIVTWKYRLESHRTHPHLLRDSLRRAAGLGLEAEAFFLLTGEVIDLVRHSAIYIRDTDPEKNLGVVYSHGGLASGKSDLNEYLGIYGDEPTVGYRLNFSEASIQIPMANLERNPTALKRPCLITAALLTLTVLTLWLWVLMGDGHLLVSNRRLLLAVGVLVIVVGVGGLSFWTLFRTRRKLDRLSAVLAVILLFPFGLWVQRHTDLGVSALGGSSFWAHQAARSPDAEAIQDLDLILSATQYGVDAAERAVRDLESKEQRRRLFLLLADRAPTERWAERYRHQAEENRDR